MKVTKKAIITIGISASGKSTWAKEFTEKNPGFIEINRDFFRKQILKEKGIEFSWDEWSKHKKQEQEVTKRCELLINNCAKDKNVQGIIISDTNLNEKFRTKLIKNLIELRFSIEIKEFPISWEEAIKRDTARENGVGISVISQQFNNWNEYIKRRKYIPFKSLSPAIIVDIDGTLAHINDDNPRSWYEYDKVQHDLVDELIKSLINSLKHYHGYKIIVLSGREDNSYDVTINWLLNNNIEFDELFMKKTGDFRADVIVKEEIFWKEIAYSYYVMGVIDDRPKVCRMWRTLGLKTLQVADPYIEY